VARNPNRVRIDYTPCPAAKKAIEEARATMRAGTSQQEAMDRLVIMGLYPSAEQPKKQIHVDIFGWIVLWAS
jgi:hypothetical protein